MASYFLGQLLNFIMSPMGSVGIIVGLFLIRSASRDRRVAWFLLALSCFAASLSKFQNEFVIAPSLVFPLEQLRAQGRTLAMVLVAALLVISWQQRRKQPLTLPNPIRYLIVVQIAIFLKTVVYGSPAFAILAAVVYGMLILMFSAGPVSWIQAERGFAFGMWSIAMVGVVFVLANGYQALFSLYPLTYVAGRFLGTTGNPQQAATLLAGIIPAVGFMIEHESERRWLRYLWLLLFAVSIGLILITGSRTGLLMTGIALLSFYRNRVWKLLRIGVPVVIVAWLGFTYLTDNGEIGRQILSMVNTRLFTDIDSQFTTANSRQMVWAALWNSFSQNPLFGSPLLGERLMGYGESSWLGAAAAVGIVGLVPLLLFGLACLKMMISLLIIGYKHAESHLQTSAVVAGLASLLVASFFEALLLGNLTSYLLMLFTYLSLGHYLVNKYAQGERIPDVQPDHATRRLIGKPELVSLKH